MSKRIVSEISEEKIMSEDEIMAAEHPLRFKALLDRQGHLLRVFTRGEIGVREALENTDAIYPETGPHRIAPFQEVVDECERMTA